MEKTEREKKTEEDSSDEDDDPQLLQERIGLSIEKVPSLQTVPYRTNYL